MLIALLEPAPEAPLQMPVRVLGRPVIERQARASRLAGAGRVLLLGAPQPGVEAVPGAAALAGLIADEDLVLVTAPGLIADERIIAAVVATAPALASFPDRGVERMDSTAVFAGVAVYPGELVRRVAAGLGDWDLQSTLLRMAVAEGLARVDLTTLQLEAPLIWAVPATPAEADAAATALIGAAREGCPDWPARFLHPPVEDALVRMLGPTPVTPGILTLLVVAISLAAGTGFATGWLWTGLVLVLATGPLRSLSGMLARTRLEFSRWDDLAPVVDRVAEYGWYFALAAHFAADHGVAPYVLAVLIVVVSLAGAMGNAFYRRFTNARLYDAGDFERRFSLVAGCRNVYFWTLVPFAAAGAWYAGFVAIAAYATLSFFVMQWRLFARLGEYGGAVAANFAATATAFPARPPGPGRRS